MLSKVFFLLLFGFFLVNIASSEELKTKKQQHKKIHKENKKKLNKKKPRIKKDLNQENEIISQGIISE
jgi:hypothetical protein